MTTKLNGPSGAGTSEGPYKKFIHDHLITIRVQVKASIVELASRGFIPSSWATFFLRVLCLKGV
jgi:hypothetical protein